MDTTNMEIKPDELIFVGNWVLENSQVVEDYNCQKINWLIQNRLKKISSDFSGWDMLYKDPNDNRYWELTYPKSYMHGGGPPKLSYISNQDAITKYNLT